jgi:hypothetical protein
MVLRSQGLLRTHGSESLMVVGNSLNYRASEMIVSEQTAGCVGRWGFMVVSTPAYLIPRVNQVARRWLNSWKRME